MAGGVELATAYVSLVVEGSKVAPGVKQALGGTEAEASRAGDRAGKSFTSRFGRTLKRGAGLAAGFAAVAGVALVKDSVKAASDLGESLNAVNVTFGKSAKGIKNLGEEAANAVGLSRTEFNGLAVQFSAFASTIAGDGGDVVKTMDDLTTRGADFASVMNLEVSEAMRLFQSGLAGETEPLRKFGIDLSAAAVQAHAYKEGIAEAGATLTEQQKVQARYSLLMQQTAKTQGDFKNTSDSLANSQRRLGAQWEDIQAQVGQQLLPVITDLSNWVANRALPAFSQFVDEMQRGKGFGGDVADALGDVKGVLQDVTPLAKDFVGVFADMPGWAQKLLIGGGAGLFAASKIRGMTGGGKGGGGLLGGGIQKVFVVNMGAGMGGGVGGASGKGAKGGATASPKMGKGLGFLGMLGFAGGAMNADGKQLAGTITAVNDALREMVRQRTGIDDLTTAFNKYDAELADLAKKNPGGAMQRLNAVARSTGTSVSDLARIFPKANAAIEASGVKSRGAAKETRKWSDLVRGLGGEVNKVDGKRPDVPWRFPGLREGDRDTNKLGQDVDKVGRKSPSPRFSFPGLVAGISDALRLDRVLDDAARDRTATITINERRNGATTGKGTILRHAGGGIAPGQVYTVGERGPETFVSRTAGRIIPNHAVGHPSAVGGNLNGARLVLSVDGREFNAYVSEVSDSRVVAHRVHDRRPHL